MFSQVTIRASLSGRSPALPDSTKQCGITVKPECFSQQLKAKSDVAPKKNKTSPMSKKLRKPNTNHNLALSNLRLITDTLFFILQFFSNSQQKVFFFSNSF